MLRSILRILFIAALTLFLGCSGYDGINTVGADLAKEKSLDRTPAPPKSNLFTHGHGLDLTASTRISRATARGPGRLGFNRRDAIITHVEFTFSHIPRDFYRLNDQGVANDPSDRLHGIDSARFSLRFFGNSPFGAGPDRHVTLVVTDWVDSLSHQGRDTLLRIPVTFNNSGDTAIVDTAFGDTTSPLFEYLRARLLLDSADTSLHRVAMTLTIDDTAKSDAVFTLNPDTLPRLTLYGKSAPVYCGTIGDSTYCWNGDTLVPDSAPGITSVITYFAIPEDSSHRQNFFDSTPVVSTVALLSGDSSWFHGGRFRVNVDSLFKGLSLDSIDILSAEAVFYDGSIGGTVAHQSYSEADRFPLDLKVNTVLRDADTVAVNPATGILAVRDTLYVASYTPGETDSLVYPIRKYLAAFMDPQYRATQWLEFNISPLPGFNTCNQIVFGKQVKINFTFAYRYQWQN